MFCFFWSRFGRGLAVGKTGEIGLEHVAFPGGPVDWLPVGVFAGEPIEGAVDVAAPDLTDGLFQSLPGDGFKVDFGKDIKAGLDRHIAVVLRF